MKKISKRFIGFLIAALCFIPFCVYLFIDGDYMSGAAGVVVFIVLSLTAIYFQLKKLHSHEIVEEEEIANEEFIDEIRMEINQKE